MTPTQPGSYSYTNPGEPPQIVQVVSDDGVLYARFEDDGDVELVLVADMSGTWERAT